MNPLTPYLGLIKLGGALILFIGLLFMIKGCIDDAEQTGENRVIVQGQVQTLDNVKDANDARDEVIERRAAEPDSECLLNAANPADC